jgi:hypothetical protein
LKDELNSICKKERVSLKDPQKNDKLCIELKGYQYGRSIEDLKRNFQIKQYFDKLSN